MSIHKDESQRKQLSIDELKSYSGFENCTNEEAYEIISSLEQLSSLYYELYLNQSTKQSIENDN